MNNNDYTLKLLNFQGKHTLITKVKFVNNSYYIDINQIRNDDINCPKCGGVSLTKNSTYTEILNTYQLMVIQQLFCFTKSVLNVIIVVILSTNQTRL